MNTDIMIEIDALRTTIRELKTIFDIVRLVEPRETAVLTINEEGNIRKEPYSCFCLWNRDKRCLNCTSLCAMVSERRQEKYETKGDRAYYIISKPFILVRNDEKFNVVLELVNRVEDAYLVENFGDQSILEIVEQTRRKLYEDSMTLIYNRRYFMEHEYLKKADNQVTGKIAFIMIDLKKFKVINDTMGHECGDKVLVEVAKALQENVSEKDSVIRYGGDEFLVVLLDCEEEDVITNINKFRDSISKVCYDIENQKYVSANFGYGYTDKFDGNADMIQQLLKKADVLMYEEKSKDSKDR